MPEMTIATQETRRKLNIADSCLSILDAGAGEAVLLGHSYLWDAEMWRPQIDALAHRHRVIVPELWGHGGSGHLPSGTGDLRDLARHHLSVMDRLGIDRFAVVGLSVGGMWGAELALLAPERVTSLVLIGSFVGPEPEPSRQRYLELLRIIEATPQLPEAVLDAVVPMFFARDVGDRQPHLPRDFRARLQGWQRERLLDSVVPLGRMIFNRRDMLGEIGALRMKCLVMAGQEDISRPLAEAQIMAEAIGCPCIGIAGAGHIASLEAPAAINRQLLEVLP
jgi:pimeloyl-ACP methyl ester carboxylesterase